MSFWLSSSVSSWSLTVSSEPGKSKFEGGKAGGGRGKGGSVAAPLYGMPGLCVVVGIAALVVNPSEKLACGAIVPYKRLIYKLVTDGYGGWTSDNRMSHTNIPIRANARGKLRQL